MKSENINGRLRWGNEGYAVLAVVIFLALGTLAFFIENLQETATRLDRDRVTARALSQAKEALIGWSAAHSAPGHMLCPAPDEAGEADTINCGWVTTRVGRLPWKTLGLPDLRDGHGEQLWYAVSRCFLERANDSYCGTYSVNGNTEGQLNIQGEQAGTKIIAVIFSPGPPTLKSNGSLQERSTTSQKADVTNYLEGENADGPAAPFEDGTAKVDIFELRTRCASPICGGPFNDQMVQIRPSEFFPVIENAVARRIEKQIARVIEAYRKEWRSYPYAAPFDPRPASHGGVALKGQANLLNGLMPVNGDRAEWALNGTACYVESLIPSVLTVENRTSVNSHTCQIELDYSGPPNGIYGLVLRLTSGSETAFLGRYSETTNEVYGDLDNSGSGDPCTTATSLVTVSPLGATRKPLPDPCPNRVTWNTDVGAFGGGYRQIYYFFSIVTAGKFMVTIETPVPSDYLHSASVRPLTKWFFDNEWYRQTYYQFSQGFASAGISCGGLYPCLSIDTALPPTPVSARMALILAGAPLTPTQSSVRGTGSVAAPPALFFEGENNALLSGGDLNLLSAKRRSPINNDKLIYTLSPNSTSQIHVSP